MTHEPGLGLSVKFDAPHRVRMDFRRREKVMMTQSPPRPETTFLTILDELVVASGDIRKRFATSGIIRIPNSLVLTMHRLMRYADYIEDEGGDYILSLKRVQEECGDEAYEELFSCLYFLGVLDVVIPTAPAIQRHVANLVSNFTFPQITSQIEEEYTKPRTERAETGLLIGPRSSVSRAVRRLSSAEEGEEE